MSFITILRNMLNLKLYKPPLPQPSPAVVTVINGDDESAEIEQVPNIGSVTVGGH
jgi:hypothetical protein